IECATTGIVILTFLGAWAPTGRVDQPKHQSTAEKIAVNGFIRKSPYLRFCQLYFRTQFLPQPFIRGTELLALMNLEYIPGPRNLDVLDGLDPARPGAHQHDTVGQRDRFDQIMSDEDNCFLGRGPRSEERRVGKECRSRWSPY